MSFLFLVRFQGLRCPSDGVFHGAECHVTTIASIRIKGKCFVSLCTTNVVELDPGDIGVMPLQVVLDRETLSDFTRERCKYKCILATVSV